MSRDITGVFLFTFAPWLDNCCISLWHFPVNDRLGITQLLMSLTKSPDFPQVVKLN
uniref:Uncharacterized protein n=1 Tax=Cyanidium caldarium TaxID=2771 RepID=Q9TLY8_CYACA|nr:hypothetical protein JXY51_pgp092 [Cyanidium caldarium]AAF12965.1 unknown [Cyanidium caldarium]